jgi:hypothetical protein
MMTILSALVLILAFRVRSRASLELELISLRHQVSVLRRRHKGRIRLFSTDRLLWVWLSFPKITSGRIDGAIRPRSEWLQWRQTVGRLDLTAHLSVMPSAYALDCNTLRRRKESGVGAPPADDHLVQALATQCANQTFRNAILPRRSRRDRPVADTHRPHPTLECMPVGSVIVAHQIDRRLCIRQPSG